MTLQSKLELALGSDGLIGPGQASELLIELLEQARHHFSGHIIGKCSQRKSDCTCGYAEWARTVDDLFARWRYAAEESTEEEPDKRG